MPWDPPIVSLVISITLSFKNSQRTDGPQDCCVSLLKRKNALPVILHADHRPAVLLRLVVKRLREGADLAVGQALGRAIGVFARGVVLQEQHLHPTASAPAHPLTPLPLTTHLT